MKLSKTLMATAAMVSALTVASSGAFAAEGDSPYGSIGGTVTFTNDYVFRGISLSDEHPAVQGSIDWSHPSGFNAGVWGSNLQNGGQHLELDWYLGYSGEVQSLSYSVSLVYYTYPYSNGNDEYWEGLASIGYDFGFLSTTLGVGYSPSQSGLGHDDATWIYGDVNIPIPVGNTDIAPYVFAHLGYQDAAFGPGGYYEWNGGAGFSLVGLDFKLMYIDTDEKDDPLTPTFKENDLTDPRFVFLISKSL
jgi:uncharacterized protein (TIGR02001 family)